MTKRECGLQEGPRCHLLGAEDGNATLEEALWVFLVGDVKVDREDEVGPGEVQVHGKSHLQGQKTNVRKLPTSYSVETACRR